MSAISKFVASAVFATALAAGSAQASTLLPDGGFETQGAASGISGSYCYGTDCASGAWTFAPLVGGSVGDGLISQSSGAWGAPIGNNSSNYFAFVQINGLFSQTFQATQSGSAVLDWIDAARTNSGGTETYNVLVNNALVGTYSPTNAAFAAETSLAFSLIAGDFYTVAFQGVDPNLNDNTAFIDNVSISVTPTPLPSTWVMLIAGFMGFGFLAYRGTQKNSAAFVAA